MRTQYAGLDTRVGRLRDTQLRRDDEDADAGARGVPGYGVFQTLG